MATKLVEHYINLLCTLGKIRIVAIRKNFLLDRQMDSLVLKLCLFDYLYLFHYQNIRLTQGQEIHIDLCGEVFY